MNEQEELQRFMDIIPDIEQLRRQYTDLQELLAGEFKEPSVKSARNVYPLDEGTVISWRLFQGGQGKPEYAKDPTYGRVPIGRFDFGNTEHTEVVTVLKGLLEAEVSGTRKTAKPLEKIVAPAGSSLKLDVRSEPVFYFCEYMRAM